MAEDSLVHVNLNIVKRLESFINTSEKGVFGILFGLTQNDSVSHILGAAVSADVSSQGLEDTWRRYQEVSPGLSPVGLWFKMNQGHLMPVVKQVWDKVFPKAVIKKFLKKSSCLVWPVGVPEQLDNAISVDGAQNGPHVYVYNGEDGEISRATVVKESSNILDESLLIRMKSGHKLGFELGRSEADTRRNVKQALAKLEKKLNSELSAFLVLDSQVFLPPMPCDLIDEDGPCAQILEYIPGSGGVSKKKSEKGRNAKDVVDIELLFLSSDQTIDYSPAIQHVHENFKYIQIPFTLDVALPVLRDAPIKLLGPMLGEAALRQFKLMGNSLLDFVQNEFKLPKVYHFKPTLSCHLITLVYPEGGPEEKLAEYRKGMQHLMILPIDQPLLRKSVAYRFPNESLGVYLTNTHIGLNPSGVEGGRVFMVEGIYAYHHYMQDRFDDDKWGCAYRSLQTLVSWLRYQGYTTKPVPSHVQIQQALVDIGDKEKNFVGSRQWIGSTEVSYLLDHMFDVSCKIIYVSSGAEMPTKARELAMHFAQHGTPVMIGGGVLAHTILGVDFNDVTGDVKWLILDPHYTGAEDLNIIQDKGWCGWKGPKFWNQTAYYNMCLPQRPKMV